MHVQPLQNTNKVQATIKFQPGQKCPQCREIKFIQVLHVYDPATGKVPTNLHGTMGGKVPREWKRLQGTMTKGWGNVAFRLQGEGAAVKQGYMVDLNPQHFPNRLPSIFFTDAIDPKYKGKQQVGSHSKKGSRAAVFWDEPGSNWMPDTDQVWEFETAAICAETGEWLGSVRWGFSIPGAGPGKKAGASLTPQLVSECPSASFLAAVSNFMEEYWPARFIPKLEPWHNLPHKRIPPTKYGYPVPRLTTPPIAAPPGTSGP